MSTQKPTIYNKSNYSSTKTLTLNDANKLFYSKTSPNLVINGTITAGNETVYGTVTASTLTTTDAVNLGQSNSNHVINGGIQLGKLPRLTQSVQPTDPNDLVTKAYTDGSNTNILPLNNTWTGTNNFTNTVSGITKSMVGLSNVDNTTDANKPVSTPQQTALNLKANLANPTFTGTVSGITKTMVGLANVDNTTDANKPVSTAQQTALNLKANIADPTFTGNVTASTITASYIGGTTMSNSAFTANGTTGKMALQYNPLVNSYYAPTVDTELAPKRYVDGAVASVNTSSQTMNYNVQATTQMVSAGIYTLTAPYLGSSSITNSTGNYYSVYLNTNQPVTTGAGSQTSIIFEVYWYYQNGTNLQSNGAIFGFNAGNPASNGTQAIATNVIKRATPFTNAELCSTGSGKNSYATFIINNCPNGLVAYQLTASNNIWSGNAGVAMSNNITVTALASPLLMSFNPIRISLVSSSSSGQKVKIDFGYPYMTNSPGYYANWINSLGYYINIKSGFDASGNAGWYLSSS